MLLCDVAVPVPLAHALTYAVPPSLANAVVPGARVACAVRKRRDIGVVLEVRDGEPPVALDRLLAVDAVLDERPCVPAELLSFVRELAGYYFAPIGEVLRLALPALERGEVEQLRSRGLARSGERGVGGRAMQVVVATSEPDPEAKLRGTAPRVLAHVRALVEVPVADLAKVFPTARAAVKRLAALGLVRVEVREAPSDPFFADQVARDAAPELTAAQRLAVGALAARLASADPAAFLLHGVTGSGKTEVYLRAIETCLGAGRGALVLVPEIALTPQLVARFRARFGDRLAVLHSALGERARHQMWKLLREGRVQVAIGARSALFAPVERLGLVVVDEEHDGSFKQEEGVRYHARDMALLRALRARAVCVLGSATPSLESEALARAGKLARLALPDRAHAAASLPRVELVDLRRTGHAPSAHPLVSMPLQRAIEGALARSEQVILFLNRRGFAPSVVCDGCGTLASCPHCSVSLTLHRSGGGRLRCHYCDYDVPMWAACASCGCPQLELVGLGTERLEEQLAVLFHPARVARLDRDVAAGTKSDAVLARMRRRQIDILVGTQMVTKGHDLPDVTVVGVVQADVALSLPDFRAAERTFQLLVQVAGRAGRAGRPGLVIVQTRLPEHAALRFAVAHDVTGFVEHELGNRRDAGYPPFARLVLVRLDAADERRARAEAERLAAVARREAAHRARSVQVLGPSPAPLERLRGRFRFRVVLRATQRSALRVVARAVDAARAGADRLVRVAIDVDPVQMM